MFTAYSLQDKKVFVIEIFLFILEISHLSFNRKAVSITAVYWFYSYRRAKSEILTFP